jgi:hypothetical protein
MAQICFADSTDLTGSLPGQVLLIFGDEDTVAEPERLLFKWLPLGIKDLVTDVPEMHPAEVLTAFYAVRHRTEDWPDALQTLEAHYQGPEHIAVMAGTKIGGLPSWVQPEQPLAGRFLASLGSICVSGTAKWPFLNMPGPRGHDHGDHDLMIGDMGFLYLFLDARGNLRAVEQCY